MDGGEGCTPMNALTELTLKSGLNGKFYGMCILTQLKEDYDHIT